ncbi:cell division protein FtsW [Lachnospira sp. NSJ-43]|uniref:Probable peptidoglycan glycosyltransferase FtsW n=1 Tax=Lachnospira hominis (ex Liu et al. 2021) TaxID=2763051 RepID=A0ABR7G116_9FIRM|nr:cell division protein FtsW [Lachnospira hominis]
MKETVVDRTRKKSVKRYFDYSLLFVTIFIAGFGLIMIYSTSSYTAQMKFGNAQYYFKKQLMFMLLGFAAMYVAYRIDYHVWHKLAFPIFICASLLVFALIPFGSEANGATRWIRFGSIGVQPADVCKPAVIMMVSSAVCSYGTKLKKFRYVMLICILTGGVEAALVFVISNNMSSAIIIFLIAFVQTFIAYPGYKIYVALTGLVAAGVGGIYAWLTNMIKGGNMTESFRLNRLLVWINPENYASDKGFQTVQALYAIGSGGLFGKGLGKSLQKLGYIPESQNDMIFSIICEEIGLFGAIFVIIVFGVMLWRIAHVAQNAPDLFGTLLVSGVFAHIAIQVVLNIAVVTNFIPNTGVSLPFISYGGTSETILLAEIGLVLNVSSKIRLES